MQRELSEYIDGYLAPEERRRVEHHLETCPACRSELDSLKATVELFRALPSVAPPRSFALTRAPVPAAPPRLLRPAFLSAATTVLALVLVLVMAGDLLGSFGPRPAAVTEQTPIPTLSRGMTPLPTGEEGMRQQADAGSEKVAGPPAPAVAPTPLPTSTPAPQPALGIAPEASPAAAGPAGAVRWLQMGLALVVVILAALTVFASWQRRVGSRGG